MKSSAVPHTTNFGEFGDLPVLIQAADHYDSHGDDMIENSNIECPNDNGRSNASRRR